MDTVYKSQIVSVDTLKSKKASPIIGEHYYSAVLCYIIVEHYLF